MGSHVVRYYQVVPALIASTCARLETKGSYYRLTKNPTRACFR